MPRARMAYAHRTSQQNATAPPTWFMLHDCFQKLWKELSDLHRGAHVLIIAGKICPICQYQHVVVHNRLVRVVQNMMVGASAGHLVNQGIKL